jgi:stringent starvation protein B
VTSSRPYLVRAINDWLNDNSLTPYVLVDATKSGVTVPTGYIKDQRVVLNIAPGAVRDLLLGNEALSFSARFGGLPFSVYVPMHAVLAIYGRENGQGMFFDEDEGFPAADTEVKSEPPRPSSGGGRPNLKVVK